MERDGRVCVLLAEKVWLHHSDGIDGQYAILHQCDAAQLDPHQILGECCVGLGVFGVHGDIHKQRDMSGRVNVIGVGVGAQVAGCV